MVDVAKTMADLRTAIAAANRALAQGRGSKFTLQALRQAGSDLARFQVLHDDANGMNFSRTDVAIAFNGQITAKHPSFHWALDRNGWRRLLETIVYEDGRWATGRRRRLRRSRLN